MAIDQEKIHNKGFRIVNEYGNLKVGKKTLEDIVYDFGATKTLSKAYTNKANIIKALKDKDLKSLREISDYYYRTNGIYFRVCNYFAQMFRYDWYIVPERYDKKVKVEKLIDETYKILNYLDNSYIKKNCGDIALSTITSGAYYGLVIPSKNGIILQQLPIEYCRCKYYKGAMPIVEMNMRFFDTQFSDVTYRLKVLKSFPEDIQKGYVLYKQGKLTAEYTGDAAGWYPLEAGSAIKFDFNNGDIPLFVNAIPAIIDLEAAQDLDRRKQMQKLIKILIQKLPMDKNGDLIFDLDEAKDIHANAVEMLSNAIGVDVLTTFAEVEAVNISDTSTATAVDELEKVERSLYNALGVSQNIFNTDGNLALEKSVLNDEAVCRTLLLQFSSFFDQIAQALSSNPKKYKFRFYMLETTQYNYKELSKMYKEQVQIGYSKMLPQIALGHSQSFILNSCSFENEVLNLHEIMIPPLMSSTMSSQDVLGRMNKSSTNKSQNKAEGEKSTGRPEKPDDEKSEKTLANKESMN